MKSRSVNVRSDKIKCGERSRAVAKLGKTLNSTLDVRLGSCVTCSNKVLQSSKSTRPSLISNAKPVAGSGKVSPIETAAREKYGEGRAPAGRSKRPLIRLGTLTVRVSRKSFFTGDVTQRTVSGVRLWAVLPKGAGKLTARPSSVELTTAS